MLKIDEKNIILILNLKSEQHLRNKMRRKHGADCWLEGCWTLTCIALGWHAPQADMEQYIRNLPALPKSMIRAYLRGERVSA